MAKYTIFGAGPAGLYTAWRLLEEGKLTSKDTVELIEWGHYSFKPEQDGTRNPAGRICSYHYKNCSDNSYIEVGGMRYLEWDGENGHQLVTKTITAMGLDDKSIPFNTTVDPLFFLRGEHFYQSQLGYGPDKVQAPYNTPGNNEKPADLLISNISQLMIGNTDVKTREEQCRFYDSGTLPTDFNSFVYNPGQIVSNIGYWNIFYDQAGNEGYNYAADAGGYSSNVINWNAANAAIYNSEFAPGGSFKTLSNGYSSLFKELFIQCEKLSRQTNNASFSYIPKTRLHSIWSEADGSASYRLAKAGDPDQGMSEVMTSDYVFMAMPPQSIELIAQATRYQDMTGKTDFLNTQKVRNYLSSVILQPSYKVAMFFDRPWWESSKYPPKLVNPDQKDKNVFGPTITDLPLRQVYYFGDNAPVEGDSKVYGILASYDDMRFTQFWQVMQLSPEERRHQAISQDLQPMEMVGEATETMTRMLLLELAKVHYGHPSGTDKIPAPLETRYMDWGLNPFGAGYHAWAPNYEIGDVMENIRTPARLGGVNNNNVFIVGSAFSDDQAWVEGAFATAESVLNEFFHLPTMVDDEHAYPLICRNCQHN